ncbi:hypothetical protein P4H82_32610, partial [Bacillus cereus]|nr:hypothetical protein [Bacillus cereus]
NEKLESFIAMKFIFIVLGATCSVRLMGMGYRHITIKLRLYNIKYSRDYFFFLKARLRKFKGLHAK